MFTNYINYIHSTHDSLAENFSEWFSLVFLCTRMLFVCYYASKVHEKSMNLLESIQSISTNNYNFIVTRFHDHLSTVNVALTGKGLFYVTKSMILGVKKSFHLTFIKLLSLIIYNFLHLALWFNCDL